MHNFRQYQASVCYALVDSTSVALSRHLLASRASRLLDPAPVTGKRLEPLAKAGGFFVCGGQLRPFAWDRGNRPAPPPVGSLRRLPYPSCTGNQIWSSWWWLRCLRLPSVRLRCSKVGHPKAPPRSWRTTTLPVSRTIGSAPITCRAA